MTDGDVPRRRLTTTSIHITALDGIIHVNSLFTISIFLGLSLNPSDPKFTLVDPTGGCAANSSVAENMVAFHVYSFSSFLFSSLIAFGLKQAIRTANSGGVEGVRGVLTTHVNLALLRAGIFGSAVGSLSGYVFLTLALIDLIQLKLGSLACWSWYSLAAVGPLVVLVFSALVIYACIILHAYCT